MQVKVNSVYKIFDKAISDKVANSLYKQFLNLKSFNLKF